MAYRLRLTEAESALILPINCGICEYTWSRIQKTFVLQGLHSDFCVGNDGQANDLLCELPELNLPSGWSVFARRPC